MRAIIQRVSSATVSVDANTAGHIEKGLLVYLGVGKNDSEKDVRFFAEKIANLRIFEDENSKINRSVTDIKDSVCIVSNFTLYGDCRKGRRPGFDDAAEPAKARQLYEKLAELLKQQNIPVVTGIFAAHMHVESVNDGPVNFILTND